MLKEFGFLSDGGFLMVTPADLKGSAVGEGAARTKALLDGAKGKVVFIDEAYNLDPARHTGSYGAEVRPQQTCSSTLTAHTHQCLPGSGHDP